MGELYQPPVDTTPLGLVGPIKRRHKLAVAPAPTAAAQALGVMYYTLVGSLLGQRAQAFGHL